MLIYIPGGEVIHTVFFDSPYPMARTSAYPASRASADHQRRIESVVTFYEERFGKPVWLMGHSNGSISIAEFIRARQPPCIATDMMLASRSMPSSPRLANSPFDFAVVSPGRSRSSSTISRST